MKTTAILLTAVTSFSLTSEPGSAGEPFFDSNGVRLRFTDKGSGTAVLLIHGYAGSVGRSWREPGIIDALVEAGFRVVAYDNRGHGRSGKPHSAEKYGMEMIGDIGRMLDHLKIERAHVVGYSMGAVIANKFCEQHPQRLISITLAGYGQPPLPDRFTVELEQQIETNLRKMALLDGNDPKALGILATRWSEWSVTAANLERNKVPALALIGREDQFLADTRKLAELMPSLRVKTIPGDHGAAPHRPEFTKELLAFLGSMPQE